MKNAKKYPQKNILKFNKQLLEQLDFLVNRHTWHLSKDMIYELNIRILN